MTMAGGTCCFEKGEADSDLHKLQGGCESQAFLAARKGAHSSCRQRAEEVQDQPEIYS